MKKLNFGPGNNPNKTVVHCPTQGLAQKVLSIADSYWYFFRWEEYKEDTCIELKGGYQSDLFYKELGYTILPAEEFIRLNTEVENPFKVGDRVYCFLNGWGVIKEIENKRSYPVRVLFDRCDLSKSYTSDGRWKDDMKPTLSFTEYTLQNFTQERPKPEIKEGQLIYVRLPDGEWRMKFFSHWGHSGNIATYADQRNKRRTVTWPEYSLTNPLEEK